ncbi:MAG: DEAD/DEAH box helicase family protein, partial [Firmicutes bacterium]|nr:DEAD/DEAH box helicase family protein [Bacillota bacterium]
MIQKGGKMKGEYHVSDILTPDRLRSGVLNVLQCPTGSGKTHAILKKLPQYVDSNNEILFVTDSVMNCSQILQQYENTSIYHKDWREFINAQTRGDLAPKGFGSASKAFVTVMNYHQVGAVLYYGHPFDWSKFTYIILDEAHNLINYQSIKSKDGAINVLKYTKAKIDETLRKFPQVKIIAVTATPNQVFKRFRNAQGVFTQEEYNSLKQYEVEKAWYYRDVIKVLDAIPLGKRGLIYTSRISNIKMYQDFLVNKGHRARGFWSLNAEKDHPMTAEQKEVRQYIIEHKEIPPSIDILLINKAAETGVNIKNNDLTFMIIHAAYGSDTFIQAKGRIRNDIPNLYYYDKTCNDANINIPEEYLNTKLTTGDKKILCNDIVRYLSPNGKPYQW